MTEAALAAIEYRTRRGRWVILATVLGSAIAAIDSTVVGIALPVIGREFHASTASVQWIVTAYLLMLASLLVVGGALGDMFGRRRVFVVGVVWFTLASAACAAAPNATVLIVTRAVQGIGGALLVPGSLAIIESSFVPGDRPRAIGAWSGLGGVATAAGPLVGGYLVSAASWRWIFLVNVPVGIAVVAVTLRHVPESGRSGSRRRIDLVGALLTVLSLGGITFALVEGPALGWTSGAVVGTLVVGVVAGGAFVLAEGRDEQPMVPLSLFRRRVFVVVNGTTLLVYAALGGALFLLPIALEVVDHYSPLEAGVSLLPLTAVMLALSPSSGRLAARIGPRLQLFVGPLVVGAGLALLARSTSDAFYPSAVLPAVLLFGLGLAVTVAPLTATALGAVDDDHAGLASAVNNAVARAGGLVAVALLPALAGLGGAAYLHARPLEAGFRTAVFIAAGWCGAGGLLAAAGLRRHRGTTRPARPRLQCALDATPLSGIASRPPALVPPRPSSEQS